MSRIVNHVTDHRGYVLQGDSRGITVPWTLRHEVYDWAVRNKIAVEYQGSMSGLDLWYIKDDVHRSWFALRWSDFENSL